MLVRDLGALCWRPWAPTGQGYVLYAPKGSVAVVEDPCAEQVVRTLRRAGVKLLQSFALAIDAWSRHTGGRDPDAPLTCTAAELASEALGGAGVPAARDGSTLSTILHALARVRFLTGPQGNWPCPEPPGPPVRVWSEPGAPTLCLSPSPGWIRELRGPSPRVAKLPRAFLRFHSKNDRYVAALTWYVALMLRVNRKYGFSYRVRLRTVLDGVGMELPRRNRSRFLVAIYRALERLPGVVVSGPPFTMFSADEILAAPFRFCAGAELIAAYAGAEAAGAAQSPPA